MNVIDGIMLYAYISMRWAADGTIVPRDTRDVVYIVAYAEGAGYVEDQP